MNFKQPNYHEEIRDELFFCIADKSLKKIDSFIELFETSSSSLANVIDRAPLGNAHKLVRVFQLWRESLMIGSRSDLRIQLDQFSVFAGRNPLVS